MARLKQLIREDPQGWETAWKENITPWDYGQSQPPLSEVLLTSGIPIHKDGRALVPGSGNGYDAITISKILGIEALAVDISATAVGSARRFMKSAGDDAARVSVKEVDFFTFEVDDEDRFSLMYDYTFFVALPKHRRIEWGSQATKLVRPGGYLITLVWPLVDPANPNPPGPPNPALPEHYAEVLGEAWEKVFDKVPETSQETHLGQERIVVWRRIL
ncbi:S-adenosyl-L-methionine-dependent methyltransferase [Pterulicium gracile]|uniref:S-adenosyl-L-methionine-dependent methyltransferase n=1 Tax=Pterulicium gracile TaxID=1884261 RepID=A0A5C3R3Y8_9AGAR|nr:S-adenosyl-L-methionine-dependent methyltransferase [Pterula gracilis]